VVEPLRFDTTLQYTDRESKAKYVWEKYQAILKGRILDVGADQRFLKDHLGGDSQYWGIGLGGTPDQQVNLEKEKVPFPDSSFDCVLCLDVLEHLDNIHEVFDDLCRVSRRYVIISLPNPWNDFYGVLRYHEYRPGQATKFYGLPVEPPEDRHKWFFSYTEAERFIRYRAEKSGMKVLQIDASGMISDGRGWRGWIRKTARKILFRRDLKECDLFTGALWAVLEKGANE
jgi:hypothetical protein